MRLLVQPGLSRPPNSTRTPTGDPNSFVYLDLAKPGRRHRQLRESADGHIRLRTVSVEHGRAEQLPSAGHVERGRDLLEARPLRYRGLQLRLETYNLFNHANLFVRQDGVDMSASTRILAFRGGTGPGDGAMQGDGQRRIQLGIRFDF